ncbi:MAG TPA: hypothetical protein VHD31_00915 [Candidatus Paceibacterota bacterium]|nr:hypothetical protein [Candidatus Paceibacterota bacterium]
MKDGEHTQGQRGKRPMSKHERAVAYALSQEGQREARGFQKDVARHRHDEVVTALVGDFRLRLFYRH